ncbi:MAG: hypothetical protein U0441_11720 [Polyangiaceae bacterium]
MKKPFWLPVLFTVLGLLALSPAALAGGASVTATASASVNLKLAPDPTGMYLVGVPAVPIVRPHRITLGLVNAGVVHTRVFGLGVGRVVFVGVRAVPIMVVGAPVAVVGAPGVVVGAPAVAVGGPGVVVGSPGVVVGAPGVVVGGPTVVVGAPGVVVGAPGVVVGSPGVVVVNGGKGHHDNGWHGKHRGKGHR